MKKIKVLILLLACAPRAFAALQAVTASAVDTAGSARTNFNSNESIGFLQKVSNNATSNNLIAFTYSVTDPNGKQVFSHSGNAAPGSVTGESASQITGIPVSQIYTVPGDYTLTTTAVLDGQTVTQTAKFQITSPIITLLYPYNSAKDLVATPLTLSWAGSGASRYRILLDDDFSFYNTLFTGLTNGSETTFTYPDNPTDSKQKLAAGQIYYWTVQGLDANGNKISEAGSPFNFTLQQPSSKSRDVAVTNIEILPEAPVDEVGAFAFSVTVKNQGNQTESNVPVNLYINGNPAKNSGNSIANIAPAEAKKVLMQGILPANVSMAIALATIDFFDDNIQNNRFSMNIDIKGLIKNESAPKAIKAIINYTFTQVWNIVQDIVFNPFIDKELKGYQCAGWEAQGLNQDEANALVEDLKNGKAKITKAWVK